jgi:hypothetical protein
MGSMCRCSPAPSSFPDLTLASSCRNIVTHHAEDGSSMGSAIVASAYRLSFLPLCPGFQFPLLYLYLFFSFHAVFWSSSRIIRRCEWLKAPTST